MSLITDILDRLSGVTQLKEKVQQQDGCSNGCRRSSSTSSASSPRSAEW